MEGEAFPLRKFAEGQVERAGGIRSAAVLDGGAVVYVGTSDGSLLQLQQADGASSSIQVASHLHVSKAPIKSISLLQAARALIVLTETPSLLLLDLDSHKASNMHWLKHVQSLASGSRDLPAVSNHQLTQQQLHSCCTGVALSQRHLLLATVWRSDDRLNATSHGCSSITLPEAPCTAALLRSSIIVGTQHAFYHVSLPERSVALMFHLPPDCTEAPTATALPLRNEAVLIFDNLLLHVNADGIPLGGTLPCNFASLSPQHGAPISSSYPYVVHLEQALLKAVDIQSGHCKQAITVSTGAHHAVDSGTAFDSSGSYCAVFIKSQVWLLAHISYSTRALELFRYAFLPHHILMLVQLSF